MGRPVILLAVFLLVVVKIPFLARNKMEVSCTFGVVVLTYTVFNNVYFLLHSVFISLFASASLSLVMFFNCFIYGCKGFSSFQFAQQFSLLSSVVISNIFHQTQIFLMFSHLLLCRFSPKSSPCPSCLTEPSDGDVHGCLPPMPPEYSGGHPVSAPYLDCWHCRHLGVLGYCRLMLLMCEYFIITVYVFVSESLSFCFFPLKCGINACLKA